MSNLVSINQRARDIILIVVEIVDEPLGFGALGI